MRSNQDSACDPADEEVGAKLRSSEMIQAIAGCLRGIVIVAGLTVIPASALSGEERPHPALIDPAITKCAVCHTNLEATHSAGASSEACLSCHTIVKRSGKTFLIVEDSQPSRDAEDLQKPEETSVEGIQPEDHGTPALPNSGAARSEAPPVETVVVIAEEKSTPSETDLPPTDRLARQDPSLASGDEASTGQLYAEGVAAFNRADFERAFNTWRAMLDEKPDHYALQVEVDSLFASAQSTVARFGDHSLFIVKKDDLYWVFSGLFATQEMAIEALKLLPEPLRQGGAFPVAVREIIPGR